MDEKSSAESLLPRTDLSKWRLQDDNSRHTWHYLESNEAAKAWPQSCADKYYMNLPLDLPDLHRATSPRQAAENAMTYFQHLQLPSGHWGCESGGPMTFTAGIVIAWYATSTPIPKHVATELKAYLAARANSDGGWGLHTTGESTVCGTAINYIVMRILGMPADHTLMVNARRFIRPLGGAVYSSTWGKIWMSVMGIVDWDIVHPMPSELWLLPDVVPFHPWRMYSETRLAGQTMCYLYSQRIVCPQTKFILSLREELLVQPYDQIKWDAHRTTVAKVDLKTPRAKVMDGVNWLYVNVWKRYMFPKSLKAKADAHLNHLIEMQATNTDFGGIAATDQPMATIIAYYRDGPKSTAFQKYTDKIQEFLWMTGEGMLINSTNGSQSWDTAFIVQAMCACNMHHDEQWRAVLTKALDFFEKQQIRDDCEKQEQCYRQQRRGCWTFSNKYQGYAVSDCTAEALRAIMTLQDTPGFPKLIEEQRIFDAIDSLLLYQNSTGGVSAFESRRGGEWLEMLNVSEIFAAQMVEYDYPECTSSCITAFVLFQKYWPHYRRQELSNFIARGIKWIKSAQLAHGGWYGSWGICFTYGTFFGLEALAAVGEGYQNSSHAKRACDFLVSKQRHDGGWSESLEGCARHEWIEDEKGSLVVQTAWAIIGLLVAEYPDVQPIKRGVQLLMSRQKNNGEWLEERIPGSFHGNCSFAYPNYKFAFTIRALGEFVVAYPNETIQ